ncbi:MAG: DUF1963 domain-containing protein [Anaerolineales bacterium]|nr:DUF1963 domain-containing protein [Anaerolineales bacterium]
MMDVEKLRDRLRRQANQIIVGGFRPPENKDASWFGRVNLARPDEGWPQHQGKPMLPLCQLNLTEMPFKPEALADVCLITVFISAIELPLETENGDGWELRAYSSLEGLVELKAAEYKSPIRPLPIRWELIEADYPSYDDVAFDLPDEILDEYEDYFETDESSKVGGWPFLIQSEIYWAPHNRHPANPEYVFQIASEKRANWQWGDEGTGYFGRGAGRSRDVWTLNWQCY